MTYDIASMTSALFADTAEPDRPAPTTGPMREGGWMDRIHDWVDRDRDGAVLDDAASWATTLTGGAIGAVLGPPLGGVIGGVGTAYAVAPLAEQAGDFVEDFIGTRRREDGGLAGGKPVARPHSSDLPYKTGEETLGNELRRTAAHPDFGPGDVGPLGIPGVDGGGVIDTITNLFGGLF